jgi:hypothetical protein
MAARRKSERIRDLRLLESRAATDPDPLGIVDHLRRRFARFELCAYLLQSRSHRFNLLLLVRFVIHGIFFALTGKI